MIFITVLGRVCQHCWPCRLSCNLLTAQRRIIVLLWWWCGLDIKGAFGTVSWKDLKAKIRELNIPCYLKNCIISFLSHRKVYCESNAKDYSSGVFQGSSLDPKLWLMMISEILEDSEHHRIHAFADDICIPLRDPAAYLFSQTTQNELCKVKSWASTWAEIRHYQVWIHYLQK